MKQKLGPLAEGQWREAFRRKFRPAPGAFVGFGGSEWSDPDIGRHFPCLDEFGGAWYSNFHWAGDDLIGSWLWLVPSK